MCSADLEIPPEHLDRAGFDPHRQGARQEERRGARSAAQKRPPRWETVPHAPAPPKAPEKKAPAFALGDRVVHTAFGRGEITKMTPMGGDALIEITFEGPGVKRLMLRAAAQHMKKEE